MRCPPIRFRRPGSGCPAVRCPVTWGRRPEGPASGPLLSTRPASSHLGSTRAVSSRLVSAQSIWTRPSPPPQAVALGPGRGGRATVTTGTGGGTCGWRAVDGSIDGRGGRDAGDAAAVALVRGRSVADPGRRVGAGRGGRACPPSYQAGQAGVRSAPRGRLRGGCGSRRQREVAAPDAWLASSSWVGDHGAWSSPSLTAGWAAPEGPGGVPAGMGVRPQRGPSRQRTFPARCRQRSDLG
jgi:hypothetical protein